MRFRRLLPLFLLATPAIAQQRLYDFYDSVGVNTHFSYVNTAYYQQPQAIIANLQKLQIHHVRDGLSYAWVAPNLYSIYSRLAAAGIHPELIIPMANGLTATQVAALLPNYPGADAVEAPNECDISGDSNWANDLVSYLPNVAQIGRDQNLTVLGPSLTQVSSYSKVGDISQYMNRNNFHWYWSQRNPENSGWGGPDAQWNYYGSMAYGIDLGNIDAPGVPAWVTESGYVAQPTGSSTAIPEWVEAVYMPRLLFSTWNAGIKRTYIYELMDEPSSTIGYGLLRGDLSPRPAFNAVAHLMALTYDAPSSFTPTPLKYSLSQAKNIGQAFFQKSDGSYWLALWNTSPVWDPIKFQPMDVATQSVTVSVPGKRIVNAWTWDIAGNTHGSSPGSTQATISVGSTITLMKITD